MRIKLTLAYDGSRFNGFQSQTRTEFVTVQGTLERAMKKLGITESVTGSGRTDTGVHAMGQVCHCDIPDHWQDAPRLKLVLNQMLLPHIYVRNVRIVDSQFHARYGAKRRIYRYLLSTRTPNPFMAPYVTFEKNLDYPRLREAIKLFEGTHELTYFKKTGSYTATDIRTIYKARLYRHNGIYVFLFEGDGFLRSQIRMMTGFLLGISKGELTEKDLVRQRDKVHCHHRTLAPPNGLYLAKIHY